jgi:hypothetical protein
MKIRETYEIDLEKQCDALLYLLLHPMPFDKKASDDKKPLKLPTQSVD